MKSKTKTALIALAVLAGGVVLCCVIFFLFDVIWDGTFVNWFEQNWMMEWYQPGEDSTLIVREPAWPAIKPLLLGLLLINILFWLAVILLISHSVARRRMKRCVTETSRMIRWFMDSEQDAADVFPREYAEIAAQMTEIRGSVQRHEQLLKEETARKNDLITYLAHDLKTPLTSVIGYLSLLDEIPDMPSEQKAKYVHISLEKAKRLESLINEFFDITRYNLQQMRLEKESFDLTYLLVQLTDEFYPLLQAHGNTAELAADESISVFGDSAKLARVFNNILKNAVAYSYPNTPIRIWTEQPDGAVKVFFQNRGKTIPAHKLDAIFEKFFRVDEARAADTGGAGLGLAIAKEIAALHGGSITAESANERTTFCVTLPQGENLIVS